MIKIFAPDDTMMSLGSDVTASWFLTLDGNIRILATDGILRISGVLGTTA